MAIATTGPWFGHGRRMMENEILEMLFGAVVAAVAPNALVAAWDLLSRTKWVRWPY